MMNKVRNIILIMILYVLVAFHFSEVQAATASLSANKYEVTVGETVTINVAVTAAAWNIHISGATTGSFANSTENGENTSFTQQYTFTPSAAGNYTVTMSGDVSEGSNNAVSSANGSITIVAKDKAEAPVATTPATENKPQEQKKSNNAQLSNLGITPNDFKGFTPGKTSYSVSVPNNVSSVNIYANKGQNGQTITGTGKKNLQEGVNTFQINVTAEDGTTKNTYTLSITREAAKQEEDKTGEDESTTNTVEDSKTEEEQKVGLSKLTIEGITLSPEFKKDVYEYTAKLIGDKTKLDIHTTAIDEGQIIEVVGNEDLKEGENIITIMVQGEDGKETTTYQITVNKSLVDEEAIAREKEEQERQEKQKQQRLIVIGVIVVAIVIVGIILLVRYIKYRRADARYFDDDDDEDLDYEETQQPKSLNSIRETAEEIINDFGNEENNDENETENFNYEENDETDETQEEIEEDFEEYQEEEKPRKRRSKGKRFKD